MSYSNTFSSTTRGGALKFYAELRCDVCSAATLGIGVADETLGIDGAKVGSNFQSSGWYADGTAWQGNAAIGSAPTWSAGDWLAVSYDGPARKVYYRNITQNSSWVGPFFAGVAATTPTSLVVSADRLGDAVTANFDGAFLGTPFSSDYVRWDGSALLAAATGILAASEAADVAAVAGAVTGEPPITITLPGGYREPPRPALVEGVGYGVLPELEGEAHGDVLAASTGAATLRLAGVAAGAAGATGRGLTRLRVRAVAHGVRGSTGAAAAVVLGLGADGSGAIGARGKSSGVIGNLKGEASGRHDDDEPAIVWLLVA